MFHKVGLRRMKSRCSNKAVREIEEAGVEDSFVKVFEEV